MELVDLAFSGCFYTRTNKQTDGDFVAKKLDRVMANEVWLDKLGQTSVDFLESGVSDHSPACISIGMKQSFGSKPFKFFNYWAEHLDFLQWVAQGWCIEVEGVPMFYLYSKLKSVKKIVKKVNTDVYGGISQKVLQARARLAQAQKNFIDSHGSSECLQKEKECLHELISIGNAEDNFLKQKARNKWLNLGDQNNAYFHRMVKVQNSENHIKHLWDEDGGKVDEVERIKRVAEYFYKKFLGPDGLIFDDSKHTRVAHLLQK